MAHEGGSVTDAVVDGALVGKEGMYGGDDDAGDYVLSVSTPNYGVKVETGVQRTDSCSSYPVRMPLQEAWRCLQLTS